MHNHCTPSNPIITNIQHFSTHDGPGIRTTVFLKGCPLHCPWCANPENMDFGLDDGLGREITCDELIRECLKDTPYYINGGGVTFSGGEPLVQVGRYDLALKNLKEKGVHLCVETSLSCSESDLEIALRAFNLFIVDLKILTKQEALNLLGLNLDIFLQNLAALMRSNVDVVWRIPLIKGYSDSLENLTKITEIAQLYGARVTSCELLAAHNLAQSKYERIGKLFTHVAPAGDEVFDKLENMMRQYGIAYSRLTI